jgi:SPP1 family predicted phage head-tail adaptor
MPLARLSQRFPRPGIYTPLGAMSKWITFYSPGARQGDGSSGPPAAAFSCWAALYAITGAEIDRAQQIAQKVSHLAVIPYPSQDIEENMTIQYLDSGQARNFQIAAIDDPDEMRWQLKIYCNELGQNAGQQR